MNDDQPTARPTPPPDDPQAASPDASPAAADAAQPKPASPPALPLVINPDKPPPIAIRRAIDAITRTAEMESLLPDEERKRIHTPNTPWVLEQFFNGEIDLDSELAQRFPNMPVMSTVSFRDMGDQTKRGVATIGTADGSAQVVIELDGQTRVLQTSFTYASMLTLRFRQDDVSDVDRTRWLELMRREQGGLAFLWGPVRWEKDYIICVVRRYFTNLYAFSPHGFEAGVRMTPDVTRQLLNWLEKLWNITPPASTADGKMLTW
jgi:hypothetical protein